MFDIVFDIFGEVLSLTLKGVEGFKWTKTFDITCSKLERKITECTSWLNRYNTTVIRWSIKHKNNDLASVGLFFSSTITGNCSPTAAYVEWQWQMSTRQFVIQASQMVSKNKVYFEEYKIPFIVTYYKIACRLSMFVRLIERHVWRSILSREHFYR